MAQYTVAYCLKQASMAEQIAHALSLDHEKAEYFAEAAYWRAMAREIEAKDTGQPQ